MGRTRDRGRQKSRGPHLPPVDLTWHWASWRWASQPASPILVPRDRFGSSRNKFRTVFVESGARASRRESAIRARGRQRRAVRTRPRRLAPPPPTAIAPAATRARPRAHAHAHGGATRSGRQRVAAVREEVRTLGGGVRAASAAAEPRAPHRALAARVEHVREEHRLGRVEPRARRARGRRRARPRAPVQRARLERAREKDGDERRTRTRRWAS